MADMSNMNPASGRILDEDGSVKNVVDILGAGAAAPVSAEVHDIESYSPRSGRVIGEDGLLYNLVDLLEAGGGGSGSDGFWRPTVAGDGTITWMRSTSTTPPASQNIKGAPGEGVPTGGTTGQVLKKASGDDFDTEWGDGGGGGATSAEMVSYDNEESHLQGKDLQAATDELAYNAIVQQDVTGTPAPPAIPRSRGWLIAFTGAIQGTLDYDRYFYANVNDASLDVPGTPNPEAAVARWRIQGKVMTFEYMENGAVTETVTLSDANGNVLTGMNYYRPIRNPNEFWVFGANQGTTAFPTDDNVRSIIEINVPALNNIVGDSFWLSTQAKQVVPAINEMLEAFNATPRVIVDTNELPDDDVGNMLDVAITPYNIAQKHLRSLASGFELTVDPAGLGLDGILVDIGVGIGTHNGLALGTHQFLHQDGGFILSWSNYNAGPGRAGYWFINLATARQNDATAIFRMPTATVPQSPTTLPPDGVWEITPLLPLPIEFSFTFTNYTAPVTPEIGWDRVFSFHKSAHFDNAPMFDNDELAVKADVALLADILFNGNDYEVTLQSETVFEFPEMFTVMARMPNDYQAGAKFILNLTEYTPKYATFSEGDVVQILFDRTYQTCFFWHGSGGGSGTVISSNGSVENIVEMAYAEFSQLPALEPNTIYNISDHPADTAGGGGGIIGNVPKYMDKTLIVGADSATLRLFHTGDSGALEVIDDDFILAFIILALQSETIFKSYVGWTVQQFQAICKGFHDAELDRMNVSGVLTGEALNANLENIVVTYSETDPSHSEIAGLYSLPDLERDLPSQSYLLKVYSDGTDVFCDARFLAMGGGSFQTRWGMQGINTPVNAGDTLNISQFLWGAGPEHRGLAGMEMYAEQDGKILFPPIASFAPYQIDIRINGEIGTGAPNAAMTFTVDLVRYGDDTIVRSYGVPAVASETLNDVSLGGLTYTDGLNDPFSDSGAYLQISNLNMGNNTIMVQDLDVTIQGTRS